MPATISRPRLAATLFLIFLTGLPFFLAPERVTAPYSPHAPIYIDGNGAFTPSNGVVVGTGTPADPFVIEGWEVSAGTSGIHIRNTDASFVLRNVYAHGAGENGIRLENVLNGRVEEVVASSNRYGILIEYSSNVIIANSTTSNNVEEGVKLWWVDGVTVTGNDLSDNFTRGLQLYFSTNATVTGNRLVGNFWGVYAYSLSTVGTVAVDIVGNTVADNSGGSVYLAYPPGIRIAHNDFANNALGPVDFANQQWDDGYPAGGNYWSDYTAAGDVCSGPLQNICPNPDGIGDLPYTIDGNSTDRYPHMAPVADMRPPVAPVLTAADLTGPGAADLTLTWDASADDGASGGTSMYRILRSTVRAGPFTVIANVTAVSSTSYAYTCPGCGHSLVDTNNTFFLVQAVDGANHTADSNPAAKYTRLVGTWQWLLTVPVQVSDPSVATVLRTLGTNVTGAWTYDASDALDPWKEYRVAQGTGDLITLPFGSAFWVNLSSVGRFTVAGLVADNPAVALQPGWNLVAYAAPASETRVVSMAGITGVSRVQTWYFPSIYRLRNVPGGEVMLWGEAYWVYLTSAGQVWMQG